MCEYEHVEDCPTGHWWSPNGRQLAVLCQSREPASGGPTTDAGGSPCLAVHVLLAKSVRLHYISVFNPHLLQCVRSGIMCYVHAPCTVYCRLYLVCMRWVSIKLGS